MEQFEEQMTDNPATETVHEMKDIVLSVIIPVYNGEKTISRAIKSIEMQPEAEHLEIIAVNDGSKDNTLAVLQELQSQYQNIHVFSKHNSGVSDTRNYALKQARGKYIAFCDADDWWEPDFLCADVMYQIKRNNVDILAFGMKRITSDSKYSKRIYPPNADGNIHYYPQKEQGRWNWLHFASVASHSFLK